MISPTINKSQWVSVNQWCYNSVYIVSLHLYRSLMKIPTCSTLASVAVIALGAILLIFGLQGRKALLAANPCSMTYSNPSFVQIATNSSLTGFTLWQHTRGKNTALLPQPVLFIHGNSGR